MTPRSRFFPLLAVFSFVVLAAKVVAHPLPDIPVRTHFDSNGSVTVEIEVDPRSFTKDPLNEPYVQKWVYEAMTDAEKAEFIAKAKSLIAERVELHFIPGGEVKPVLEFAFTGIEKAKLVNIDDAVMLTGSWKTALPAGATGYQVKAKKVPPFSVLYHNYVDGLKVERFQVLFPGENSYVMDLTDLKQAAETLRQKAAAAPVSQASAGFGHAFRLGFTDILPKGEAQLLFVVALALAALNPRMMAGEVLAFLAVNSVALALAIQGLVSAPVANGLAAASLVVVAALNLWGENAGAARWGFVAMLGWPHGLALGSTFSGQFGAGAMPEWMGFQLGVIAAVILFAALAALVFSGLRGAASYRRFVAVPVCVFIGVVGIFWGVQTFF